MKRVRERKKLRTKKVKEKRDKKRVFHFKAGMSKNTLTMMENYERQLYDDGDEWRALTFKSNGRRRFNFQQLSSLLRPFYNKWTLQAICRCSSSDRSTNNTMNYDKIMRKRGGNCWIMKISAAMLTAHSKVINSGLASGENCEIIFYDSSLYIAANSHVATLS